MHVILPGYAIVLKERVWDEGNGVEYGGGVGWGEVGGWGVGGEWRAVAKGGGVGLDSRWEWREIRKTYEKCRGKLKNHANITQKPKQIPQYT